jgi:hypothetical protein
MSRLPVFSRRIMRVRSSLRLRVNRGKPAPTKQELFSSGGPVAAKVEAKIPDNEPKGKEAEAMIEVLSESQGNLLGVRAWGKITAQDYEAVLIPRLEELLQEHRQVRFLFLIDEDFQGMELGAMWDDTKFGLKHRKDFDKMAVVAPARWMGVLVKLFSPIMSGEIRTFPREQLQEAWDWVKS